MQDYQKAKCGMRNVGCQCEIFWLAFLVTARKKWWSQAAEGKTLMCMLESNNASRYGQMLAISEIQRKMVSLLESYILT